jgi:hypothetical protein
VYLRTTKERKDREHKRMGFPAEMEMVKNWTISLGPLQQHHPREKGKAVDELAELGAAHSLTSTQRQIVKDAIIEVSTNGDEFATQVYDLLQAVIDDEFRTHKPEGQHGLAIPENSKLYRDDVYSLYCVHGEEGAAWYTDAVINTLLDVEAPHVPDVYVERNIVWWLQAEMRVSSEKPHGSSSTVVSSVVWSLMEPRNVLGLQHQRHGTSPTKTRR